MSERYHRRKAAAKATFAQVQSEAGRASGQKFCCYVIARQPPGLLVCSAPAKMAGGKAYCADHFPPVVS